MLHAKREGEKGGSPVQSNQVVGMISSSHLLIDMGECIQRARSGQCRDLQYSSYIDRFDLVDNYEREINLQNFQALCYSEFVSSAFDLSGLEHGSTRFAIEYNLTKFDAGWDTIDN